MDSSTKIVIGVVGGVVLGVVTCAIVGVSYFVGIRQGNPPLPVPAVEQSSAVGALAVGDCVKQAGADAAPADCAEQGAYRIVKIGASVIDCPDAGQPHVSLGGKVLCLAPAAP